MKVHVSAFVERLLVHVRCVMVNVIVSVHVYKCDNVHLVWIHVYTCMCSSTHGCVVDGRDAMAAS